MITARRETVAAHLQGIHSMSEETKTPLIFERLAAVMRDIGSISKDQTNREQGFKFRGIEDVLNGVQPAMAKHQVFTTQTIVNSERKEITTKSGKSGQHCIYTYKFTFWTIDGSSVSTYMDGEGIDYGDKGANKCVSIALKYALINTLLIPTKDLDDPDAECHEVVKKQPAPAPPQRKETPELVAMTKKVIDDATILNSECDFLVTTRMEYKSFCEQALKADTEKLEKMGVWILGHIAKLSFSDENVDTAKKPS